MTKLKPNIGITEKGLKHSAALLSALLADEMILYVKTRKAHWNVTGESFMELHKLFEFQYKELESSIDEVAERIGKLGQNTIGTMHEFLKHSAIKENPGKYLVSKDVIAELLDNHESVVIQLRKDIVDSVEKNKDAGTGDFLTGLMEQHETYAWVLRRYLDV
jgi:starvation-inducible DNA-binding protein